MPEIFRTRDVVVIFKGRTTPMAITPAMVTAGWPGGQGVMWFDSPNDQLQVDFSDGERGAGFCLWGSSEDSDVLTAITEHQLAYSGNAVIGSGGWIIMTRIFETLTLASARTVPILYTPGDKLLWSLRGLITNEDEWTVSADPRAPNDYFIGFVSQPPSAITEGYMTAHLTL